ncbi:hypothetical protein [Gordonia zhaorongruii]|uniref:hypothetical protein n=1 Tax=Gordonia zhaorongruii TaxID=2597659 RepID=UPI00117EF849|nr:hypothetical protein [Gordonia zhaorongruii]
MTRRNLLLTALGTLVVALILGSMNSTGALWAEESSSDAGDIGTGSIGLAPGTVGGTTYEFSALHGANISPGTVRQAVLNIRNTGTTPLRFRVVTAGPAVSTQGSAVGIHLSGAVADTCPSGSDDLTGAFAPIITHSPSSPVTAAFRPLAVGASENWCIRAVLESVTGTQRAVYRIMFDFRADQTR